MQLGRTTCIKGCTSPLFVLGFDSELHSHDRASSDVCFTALALQSNAAMYLCKGMPFAEMGIKDHFKGNWVHPPDFPF